MSNNNLAPDGFNFVQESNGINEYNLKSNGLRVLALSDRSAPVATFMVTYHVGSRNEAIGYTGSTHLLEHLMFKGSRNFNKEKGTAQFRVARHSHHTIFKIKNQNTLQKKRYRITNQTWGYKMSQNTHKERIHQKQKRANITIFRSHSNQNNLHQS